MDFDLDDPLDDILKSDNSTDSFFGAKSAKPAAKTTKSATATKSDDKTRMSNLFGIKAPEPEPPRQTSQPPSGQSVVKPKTPEAPLKKAPIPLRKKEVSFDDDDDSMTDLGFDPKKAKAKTNLFDDLLAPSVNKAEAKVNPTPPPPPTQRPKTAAVPENKSIFEEISARPKTATRSSPKKSINDPLGLFGNEKPKDLSRQNSKDANFDWLGIEAKKEAPQKPHEQITAQVQHQVTQITAPNTVVSPSEPTPFTSIPLSSDAVLLDALQRQESQLTMASHMKNQEYVLLDMQQRQKALLQQQEAKFQELIQGQINRQAHLEGSIRNQQNRINGHLQNLMNQPLDVPVHLQGDDFAGINIQTQSSNRDGEMIELQNEVKRLELEKLRFEDLFSNATAIHEQEVAFIEQSHKKQIKLLEDQVRQVEDRLKQENKTMEDFYRNKLHLLETDKNETIEKNDKKLADLRVEHQEVISHIRSSHQSTMEELKLEHRKAIGYLRDSKLMEFTQLEDRFSYLDHLKSAAKYMESATGDIESLRVTINERIETLHKDKEMELERREKRVEMEQRHLTVVQETAQNEQKRLLELVHNLESKLNSLSKESSEDQWIVRQKLAALEAERSAFEREQIYFRDQQKRDEKRIEEFKEASLRQQTSMAEEIHREKEKLAEEKVKFATLQRLNEAKAPNIQNNEHEVEIAIQVAKEAARQSDVERDNWMTRQRQCEVKKREIVEYEQQIRRKETELEVMLNAAKEREQKAENFIRNAKMMEQKVIGKYQELTQNAQDLVERERKLSEEKQALSRERMDMQAMKQSANESRCNLCKTGSGQLMALGVPVERDQVENFNYNELNVGVVSGVDRMFSEELNAILKQVPKMDRTFSSGGEDCRPGFNRNLY